MIAQHTPGPWTLVPKDTPKGTLMVDSVSGLVAVMESSKTRGVKYENAEANARLIAAAPELLDALQKLRAAAPLFWDDDNAEIGQLDSACAVADAAIAKATGTTSAPYNAMVSGQPHKEQ